MRREAAIVRSAAPIVGHGAGTERSADGIQGERGHVDRWI